MNLRTRTLSLAAGIGALSASVWWLTSHRAPPSLTAPNPAAVAAAPAHAPAPVAPMAEPPPAPPPPAPAQQAEVQATERMYLAHAPLRVPEVADPDSASNRQTLQTMVAKALQNAAAAQPAPSPHH